MVTLRPGGVDIRCGKLLPDRTRCGRLFDTASIVNDRLYGIPIQTDLADEIRALEAGRAYETPAWMGSTPYTNDCRCGNRPKLRLGKLTALVRDAVRSDATTIYI
jgi:hypothetical protein